MVRAWVAGNCQGLVFVNANLGPPICQALVKGWGVDAY